MSLPEATGTLAYRSYAASLTSPPHPGIILFLKFYQLMTSELITIPPPTSLDSFVSSYAYLFDMIRVCGACVTYNTYKYPTYPPICVVECARDRKSVV